MLTIHLFEKQWTATENSTWTGIPVCAAAPIYQRDAGKTHGEVIGDHKAPNMCGTCKTEHDSKRHRFAALIK